MRIAVSGSHCTGKSTLITDFLAAHPDYAHEPEPYEWLTELYGEEMPDFDRQLEVCVERLCGYAPGTRAIAERSPLDFLAYMLASGGEVSESAVALAAQGMAHIDLLVLLPADGIEAPDAEDPELREAMNERLFDLAASDDFELLGDVRVIELHGSRGRRAAGLEAAVAPMQRTHSRR